MQRRSEAQAVLPETRVLLGDTMGEMFAYFRAADVAFIGGSLVPTGGQNLIEACAMGTPVLIGRSTYNFSHAAEQALACSAARQIGSAVELLEAAQGLLHDNVGRRDMGEAGREFAARHRGATARTLMLIESRLADRPDV
jgi:3-deoxy-D-manno-octulosonic-acid transferase